jgi:hypothetical protein
MKIISSEAGLFGPFERIDDLGDRLRAWAAGAPSDAPGADLPVCVIGGYELLDIDVPQGFIASDYTWNGVSLLLKAPPASEGEAAQ